MRSSYVHLGKVYNRVLESLPFIFGRSVSVIGLQFHAKISLSQVWLYGSKGGLISYVDVFEREPLHNPNHVHCLFEPNTEEAQQDRTNMWWIWFLANPSSEYHASRGRCGRWK